MELYELLNSHQNLIYTSCLLVGAGLLLLEMVLIMLIGFSALTLDIDIPSAPLGIVGVLGIGKIPLIIWIFLTVTGIGVYGTSLNLLYHDMSGVYISTALSLPLVLTISIISTRLLASIFGRFFVMDIGAFNLNDAIGMKATIVTGTAKSGLPAEALIIDKHNRQVYVMVEPLQNEEFKAGETVVIYDRKSNSIFSIVSVDSI